MGIFGSDTKTYVDTVVMRLVEDGMVPNIAKTSILESVFRGGSAAEGMIEQYLNGTHFRKAYNYAKQGKYFYGLPNTTILTNMQGADEVKAVLDVLTGQDITLEYLEYSALNYTHIGWQELVDTYGYNTSTNEITVLSTQIGFPTYLEQIVPVYKINTGEFVEPGMVDTWGPNSLHGYTPERKNNGQVTDLYPSYEVNELMRAVKLFYVWEANGEIQKASITINLDAYPLEEMFYQVRYSYTDGMNQLHYGYWTYLGGQGTYPTLDAIYAAQYTNPGTYFPFALIRRNKLNMADISLHESEEYKTTRKLLRYIGIDFDSFSDSIHASPDIGDVDQATVMMGVPITSTNPIDMEYLYQFFLRLHTQTPYEFEDGMAFMASRTYKENEAAQRDKRFTAHTVARAPKAPFAISFQDADFRLTLSYGGVIRTLRSGQLGPIGTLTNTANTKTYLTSRYSVEEGIWGHTSSQGINRIICKQVTPNFYDEITIIDPTLRFSFSGGYSTYGSAKETKLLIPLDMSIAERFSTKDSVILFNRSLHLVINARVVEKLEWYETSFFRFVMQGIAIVITFLSLGAGSFLNALAAAIGAGLVATTLFLIEYLVYYLLFQETFKIVVKEIGLEAAMVLAIIAAAVGIAKLKGIATRINTVMAENLLMASSGLMLGTKEVLQDMFLDLQNEFEAFSDYRDETLKELEKTQELLKNDYTLQPFILLGEKPQDFYNRTVHSGNIGIVGIQYVESYVEHALRLPDINDSMNTFGGSHGWT